uniref:Prolycopene isomerase-like3 n=1 Tax=Scytosiphon lomentaria TaxID=27967 RepID=A0A2D2AH29_SCYLO|nr:prolycopene isomerase-like3 [Scytosiphon lomentaria]
MRRRQLAVVITALSSSSWWASVDSFVPPHANPFATGVNSKADIRRSERGGLENLLGVPRLPECNGSIGRRVNQRHRVTAADAGAREEEAEVVVIGSGIAGLCTAALLTSYGKKVVVCESHTQAGGCAHGFDRKGYKFDSGPSLFSGMSISPTPNPLKHVFNAIGEDVEWLTYDTWGVKLPEGYFDNAVGPEPFRETISRFGGPGAQEEWDRLTEYLLELSECTMGLPPFSLRTGPGAVVTMAQFLPTLVKVAKVGQSLQDPFTDVLKKLNVTDPFVTNWLNLLCFLLQGLPSDGTTTAVMSYMIADWCRPGVVLDYPKGGTEALVDALVRGVEAKGGKVMLGAHVEKVVVEEGKACGVRLRSGKVIRASRSVVSNASIWDTLRLVPEGALPEEFVKEKEATPQCKSFMHVHLGVRCHDLIDAAEKEGGDAFSPRCHYAVVADWGKPIDAAGNVIVVSIPSVLDPSLAPAGCHTVHAYTAGCEPFAIWEGLDPKSEEYRKLKEERAQVLMDAVEAVFPNLESRLDVRLIGTPLTAQRFLRRDRGTYGPEVKAGRDTFAGPNTPLPGLVCTGDSVWPGIGVPAVAASGTLVANMMVSPLKQLRMLKNIDFGGVGVGAE